MAYMTDLKEMGIRNYVGEERFPERFPTNVFFLLLCGYIHTPPI